MPEVQAGRRCCRVFVPDFELTNEFRLTDCGISRVLRNLVNLLEMFEKKSNTLLEGEC